MLMLSMNGWISFETNFLIGNYVVKQDVQGINTLLPGLYNLALQLLCNLPTDHFQRVMVKNSRWV